MQTFRYIKDDSESLQFTAQTVLCGIPQAVQPIVSGFAATADSGLNTLEVLTVSKPVPQTVKQIVSKGAHTEFTDHAEGFVLVTADRRVTVYADTDRGVLNGLMTFLRLLNPDACYNKALLWDYPFSILRGVKLMMPARGEIEEFKRFVDMMMYFRHNTLMLEIGGAMEYKRHPEINEGWEEYAAFMSEYSGKAKKLQEQTFPWRKNSIHCNNGGGSFLSQQEVGELIAYCEERGIEIIPEIPSTSHCDYLLTRHPELAERPEDPYPDTFCPSNPDSYNLLFDVLDEVIEVFHPKVINVGHDEYYSINICDRCRKRLMDATDIYAEDLTKIYEYLASKNVKTMIWCDKLMNVLTADGANFGGALNFVYEHWNVKGKLLGIIPPTWQAIEKIPKDIICLNWFWSFGEKYDEDLREFPVVFGNFSGAGMNAYHRRCGENTSGGICSNWGATTSVYLQRNCIYFSMAYADNIYWNPSYDDTDDCQFADCVGFCFEELFRYHYGTACNRAGRYVEITHTTNRSAWYRDFVDGVFASGEEYRKDYYLGDYCVAYTDGTFDTVPVFLGENIGNQAVSWYGREVEEAATDATPGQRSVRVESHLGEVAYSTLPSKDGDTVWYTWLFENPQPDKQIQTVTFRSVPDAPWEVRIKKITVI